jgi:filamentous hemagglutinin
MLVAARAAPPPISLPVPCAAGSCGANAPQSWVSSGTATATQVGNTLTVNQTSNSALLNWQKFNISANGTVNFVQPSAKALAVNRIFQADPSKIFGALNANGRIYLINQNGILFGAGAQINVAGIVASTLDISPDALLHGIAPATVNNSSPAFQNFPSGPSGAIEIDQGAMLSAPGGQIFLFAPQIDNRGTISTPDGQTILAAGNSIFLATSVTDPNVRGLLVEVSLGGTVNNGPCTTGSSGTACDSQAATDPGKLIGQIVAAHGNVTLLGLAVNQNGRVSASTTVRANGTIKLVAADNAGGGSLRLWPGSRTEVGLDTADTGKAVDATAQLKSEIDLEGNQVTLASHASVVAPSGVVTASATGSGVADSTAAGTPGFVTPTSVSDGSRVNIEDNALIDVSGATATLPIESNVLRVELRGSQLADSPLQRSGALRSQPVFVDIRQSGTRGDGSTWYGTPLADLTGDIATIQRGVVERNLTGGSVILNGKGDVLVSSAAHLDVSGGAIHYLDGYINTSSVVGADGKLYNIANASPDVVYTGVANTTSVSILDRRWGVTKHYPGIFADPRGQFEAGYVEGKDAGSLLINAPHVILDAALRASVQIGPLQRKAPAPPAIAQLYRPFDQVPLPGLLQLGAPSEPADPTLNAEEVLSDVRFGFGPVLPTLKNADGTAFNPASDL